MHSLKGHFLVATPELGDPNFIRTVVLMIHHDADGAFGVIVNRATNRSVKELWEHLTGKPCKASQPLHIGGPVSGPLIAIHTRPDLAELEVIPGLFFCAARDKLEQLVEEADQPFRLFIGHSGWGKGQLERELREGAWLTLPATVEDVFSEESSLWRRLTYQVGRSIIREALRLPQLPLHAELN
ncbi:MAG: YqgE/AlgH family protein [Thermoguttaceae bacterium]|nr:YqgE/AlgH family protein [Thermoguttaceae bacterium]MDW8079413.1 YqgE/AlgH family protein [Thermoguttaceae bacterium]